MSTDPSGHVVSSFKAEKGGQTKLKAQGTYEDAAPNDLLDI